MKCTVCGAGMEPILSRLSWKHIVILKQLPVLQCGACREYLIEDAVMTRIDTMLERVDETAELEVIRYAA